jgi:uroporphyrinogen decarboxylase
MSMADRPPIGAWGHTYREEWSPAELAAITVKRARHFGWDFVKFQPRAGCFAEAFGSVYKPAGHRLRAPVLVSHAVSDLESWRTVSLVNRKALDDQVEAIGIVARELGPDVPVLQTVFGLNSVEAGAAGIFYAISGYASRDAMPEAVYRQLVLPYDIGVLDQLPRSAWFNTVHLCGSNLHFGLARDLPAQAVSWSIHNQGNPSLAEGRQISGRPVMGGMGQRSTLIYGPRPEIEAEAQRAIAETGGRGLLLAPGCSVPPRVRDANLEAMVSAVAAVAA